MRFAKVFWAACAVLALLSSAPARAVAIATVEAVQAPAWRDRGGVSAPLAPGMTLDSGDVLRTGSGARVYVMLAEGSRVKLGEVAQFTLYSQSTQPQRSFRGALEVLAGAFRYTTGKLKKAVSRDVAIRVGTATIGIRGTDIWGKTDSDGELVALIEGRIEITRGGQATELAQPMTYFDAPAGKASAVKALDAETLARLARQTEILAGDGAARAQGRWQLRLATVAGEEAALALYDRVRAAGFSARIVPQQADGGGWTYQLRLGGYASAAEAGVAAARLQAATGLAAVAGR